MGTFSGGILLLVGAALWVAYLFPTILRRRQYHSGEHGLALPQRAHPELRSDAEAYAGPSGPSIAIAPHGRLERLEKQERRANERKLAETAATKNAEANQARREAKREAALSAEGKARRRRLRALSSLLLLGSLATAVTGVVLFAMGGSYWIAAAGGLGSLLAVSALLTLAARTPRPQLAAEVVAAETFEPVELPRAAATRSWTPQPLPQPLHLAPGSRAAATIASTDAAAALRRAALEVAAERATQPKLPSVTERAARRGSAPAAPAAAPGAAPAAAPAASAAGQPGRTAAEEIAARYAALDPSALAAEAQLDVSAVLERRRAG